MGIRNRLILALGAVISMAALGATANADHKVIRIGLVLPELSNEAILDIDIGAKARAAEVGNVELMTTGTYSGEEQAKAMENYIAAGVDVLAYDSIDGAATGPAVVQANEAGIPVLSIFSRGAKGEDVSFLSADWEQNGVNVGSWLAEALGAGAIVAHVEGNPADEAGASLTVGFLKAIKAGGIDGTVAQAPSDWDREKGMSVATDMLTARPDIQGIYGANDDVAMGVLQAVKVAGRLDDVLVVGHNGTCEALGSILKGELDMTNMIFARPIGADMIDAAIKIVHGEEVPSFIAMKVLAIDTAWANGILDGTREDPPAAIAAETKERLERAQGGCK